MSKIKYFLHTGFLLVGYVVRSQDVSGIWEGRAGRSDYVMPLKIVLELTVINDTITGISHAYYTRGRFEHHQVSGYIDRRKGFVYLTEDKLIDFKKGIFDVIDGGTYSLKLIRAGNELKLDGEWTSERKRIFINPVVRKWFWKENKDDTPKFEPPVIPENKTAAIDSVNNTNRRDDVQMIIEVDKKDKDSIRVDLYDNGQIDNDTVSVYVNDRQVINKQMITAKPITFYISLSDNKHFDKIRLIAENLGSIPPNTALMVITTRKNKYDVFLSSTYDKSAVVEFFLKEK